MLEFILASGNKHKASELSELFKNVINVKPASQTLEVDEDGDTFVENAHKKAQAYFEHFKQPVVSDDSGLVLESYPEILGVHSALYKPEFPDYRDKCQKVLEHLSKSKLEQRKAYFICVLCFYLNPNEIFFFEGRVHGAIGNSYQGEHGFGYDPIFIPDKEPMDKKTMAELPDWKMIHSHRAKAVKNALQFFKSRNASSSDKG